MALVPKDWSCLANSSHNLHRLEIFCAFWILQIWNLILTSVWKVNAQSVLAWNNDTLILYKMLKLNVNKDPS
jgi:hypothetical protein